MRAILLPIGRRVCIAAAITGIVSSACAADSDKHIDAYYLIGGQRTGAYSENRIVRPTGEIETTIDSSIVFNRVGAKLEIKSKTKHREDSSGRYLGLSCDLSSSQQITHVTAEISENAVSITTTVGGKSYQRTLESHEKLLGPDAARKLIVTHLRSSGDRVVYKTFSVELGTIATITDKLVSVGEVVIEGQRRQGLKLEQQMSGLPGTTILWLDPSGWLLKQLSPSPVGDIQALRTMSPNSRSATNMATMPSETFTKSVITSNVRLPDERLIERTILQITHKRPDLGWPDFTASNQRILSKSPTQIVLEVLRPTLAGSQARPSHTSPEMKAFVEPNALLQSDDVAVKSIVSKVVGNSDDAWAAVRKLQKWTNENMHFDMGIAVASASEVAKNRGGTCFGYSMLLGSLVRAAGVPSRIRMGFVYAGGIWGGHAWVDTYIGGKWIPIDGALYSPGPADAARFSCVTTSLAENSLASMSSLSQLFGSIDVRVLEFSVAGKKTTVPVHAAPFSIDRQTYRNPWLGISIVKPIGFRFTSYGLTWPQSTVVALEGPGHHVIEVKSCSVSLPTDENDDGDVLKALGLPSASRRVRIANRDYSMSVLGSKAALILHSKGSRWVFSGKGKDVAKTLMRVAARVSLVPWTLKG